MFTRFVRRISRLHKIFGMVIGLQLLFWVVSGFYFTLYPIETIHGDHLREQIDHGILRPEEVEVSVQDAMDASDIWVFEAELSMFLGEPVWKLSNSHEVKLVSARTGDLISPIPEETALEIARAGVPGLASFEGEMLLIEENAPREYGGRLPVWAFETADSHERAYIDVNTGDIRAVRTTEWRIFDVLWRFHIMDITGDDRIDTWWMKLAAFLAFAMLITGIIILVQRLMRGKLFS